MNILFSIEHLEFGGAQTMVLSLTSALAEKKELSVFLYNQSPEKLNRSMVTALLSPKVKNISIDQNPVINFISWKLNAVCKIVGLSSSFRAKSKEWYFKYCLNKYKIDVVSSHLMGSDVICGNLISANIPLTITEHGEYIIVPEKDRLRTSHIKSVLRKVHALITVSDYCRLVLSRFMTDFSGISQTIYNGVTLKIVDYHSKARQQLGIADNAIIFGLMGRGIKEKGWREAIEAFVQILQQTTDEIHMVFVGEGEYLNTLKQDFSLSSTCIHYVGFTDNPGFWIDSFDIGILPSYSEALPNVVVEYLSYNKPVIATKVGGIPEAIADGEELAGFLVDILDGKPAVNQLSEYMLKYINDTDLRCNHGLVARRAFQKFKMDKCVESYVNIFEKVIHEYKITQ